jgi:Fe-S cluster assembly iron-binding protein IscA
LGIALEEPHAADEIMEVDNIKVAYNRSLQRYLDGKIVDYRPDFFGHRKFIVYGNSAC